MPRMLSNHASSFARAFKATVGMPPLDQLARWQMLRAGARLADGKQLLASIRVAGH